eukprot:COSAG01_NODE_6084_length_3862_cov_2.626893_4_plen_182_part_00
MPRAGDSNSRCGAVALRWPGVDAFICMAAPVRLQVCNNRNAVEAGGGAAPNYTSTVQALKKMLLQYVADGIRVFMVFDGWRLPGKNGTDAARLKKRGAAQAQVDAAVERADRGNRGAVGARGPAYQGSVRAGREAPYELAVEVLKRARKPGGLGADALANGMHGVNQAASPRRGRCVFTAP